MEMGFSVEITKKTFKQIELIFRTLLNRIKASYILMALHLLDDVLHFFHSLFIVVYGYDLWLYCGLLWLSVG